MKRMNRILAMLLIAVFAFSQLPMAALAAEEASGHDAVTSDTHDTGGDGGGSEPDMGAVAVAFGMTMLGEEGDEGDEGSASREVANWGEFTDAIEAEAVEVITITSSFDASDSITINRTIHITSAGEYTVDLKNASIVVVSGGSLTLDGALVLQGAGDQVIEVQEGGEATISGGTITATGDGGTGVWIEGGTGTISGGKIEATETGVWVEGGTATISGGTITATGEWGKGVNVEAGGTATISGGTITATGDGGNGVRGGVGGTVNIGGEAKISATYANTDRSTGVLAYNSTVTIKDDVKIEAYDYGVRVQEGGTATISGGTIVSPGTGVYVEGGETTINGGTIRSSTGISVEGGTVTIGGEAEITGNGEYSTGVRVLDGGGVNIGGNAKISNGISVEGGTVTIGGEAEITETFSYKTCISIWVGGTVNIGGKAKVLVTGERSYGISVQAGGTVNIGGEAEVSATGATSKGINVRAGDRRSKGVSVLESGGVNISGGTITGTEVGVEVQGCPVAISGGTITGTEAGVGVFDNSTVSISGGTITGTDMGVLVDNSTATISGGTIKATGAGVVVEGGEVTITGGTITATGEEVSAGVLVIDGEATISGGTITAIGEISYGVGVLDGNVTISGGTITADGELSFGVLLAFGDVNLISSEGLVINDGIYNMTEDEDSFELLQSLPAPISVSAGQRTAEFTLAAGEGVTFEIDGTTSVELEAEIDTDNKVTLTLPGAAGTYQLALHVCLEDTPTALKLTVPVTVNPRSGGGGGTSTPTIPAVGGAARVSYTASGGTLFLQMPATKVNEIIEKSGDSAAEFDLSRAGSATAARLPGDALDSFAQAGLDVTLRLPTGTMTLSSAAAASVAAQAADENVRIELQQAAASTLTDAQKAAVGSGDLVLDINIYSGTEKISNFDGTLAMAVPYDGPLPVAVWYLSDAGELERLDCTFEDGMVHFTLHHLSLYVVGQDTEWQNPFADVKESSWYYDAVAFIAQKGITAGTTASTFSPDATLTRGQFITMLLRAYEIAPDDGAADNFADGGDTYYTGYLAAAKRLGIANGVGDNQFAPEQAITRQEMFTLLYNALGVLDDLPAGDSGKTLSDFADSDAIADWAREALTTLVEWGIVSGSGGRLEPTATTTRAQMAQVMVNLLGK
ncbi:MAG: S-layer homology domain-containing protein [Eubacteriales bacterium]|nr:S-layer homology domain-containing protein [Eubacteriales bacterium]